MKDNFSEGSAQYARFRPAYPEALISYLVAQVKHAGRVLDVGTGTGQLAYALRAHFEEVYATDISENQLQHASRQDRIHYAKQPAESQDFEDSHFDMITAAQALHWFDHRPFFTEVKRLLKPTGVFAAIGYGLSQVEGLEDVIAHFYEEVVGPYWDPERKHIEAGYQSIDFPFDIGEDRDFPVAFYWTLDDLLGYLGTWSAVRHYQKANGQDPIARCKADFEKSWGTQTHRKVQTPFFVRLGWV